MTGDGKIEREMIEINKQVKAMIIVNINADIY